MTKFMVNSALDGEARKARMAENIRRNLPRLEPQPAHWRPLVVCGYGPSLRETWKEISSDADICTTSGAYDFLLERGRIAKYHVEYDPRARQCVFHQNSRNETTYCLASTCHAELFDLLVNRNVLLWHALGPDLQNDCDLVAANEDGILLLGGSNAGARAIMVGHVLGYREFDLHGFDCSYRHDTIWAGPHIGEPHAAFPVECNGKMFLSSDVMINSAEEVTRTILKELPGCRFTIYGDGLLAERFRIFAVDKQRALGQWWMPPPTGVIKVPVHRTPQIDALITDSYREQNEILHRFNPEYGSFGHRHAERVSAIADKIDSRDILDYGCGKRTLELALGFAIHNYDPAIADCSRRPEPADIVVCTDVFEHIEPQCIEAIFADLKRLTKKRLFVNIACRPAEKMLPDGRNAHLMIREPEWWEKMLGQHFELLEVEYPAGEVTILCRPRG